MPCWCNDSTTFRHCSFADFPLFIYSCTSIMGISSVVSAIKLTIFDISTRGMCKCLRRSTNQLTNWWNEWNLWFISTSMVDDIDIHADWIKEFNELRSSKNISSICDCSFTFPRSNNVRFNFCVYKCRRVIYRTTHIWRIPWPHPVTDKNRFEIARKL